MPLDPVATLAAVDAMAIVLGQAYQLARVRISSTGSPIQWLTVQRDDEATRACIQQRRADILCANRANDPPHGRTHFTAPQRLEIIQLMRLAGWSIEQTAANFAVHPNTIRAWINAVEGKGRSSLLGGAVVWNRMDDAVRWAANELRRVCPEPEFGTRTMARHLLRAGIQISRSTVQRVLREPEPAKPPRKPRPAMEEPVGVEPHGLLKPTKPNLVWHSDITQIHVLWFTFFIAAILDGFSRKILALKVYGKVPCARNMAALVRGAAVRHGRPEFITTDNGSSHSPRLPPEVSNPITRVLCADSTRFAQRNIRCLSPPQRLSIRRREARTRSTTASSLNSVMVGLREQKVRCRHDWCRQAKFGVDKLQMSDFIGIGQVPAVPSQHEVHFVIGCYGQMIRITQRHEFPPQINRHDLLDRRDDFQQTQGLGHCQSFGPPWILALL